MALNPFEIYVAAIEVENNKRAKISKSEFTVKVTNEGRLTTVTRNRDGVTKDFHIKVITQRSMEEFMDNLTAAQLSDMFTEHDKMMKKLAKEQKDKS